MIFLPTLNYHSRYVGITSAVKSHLVFCKSSDNPGRYNLHSVGFRDEQDLNHPEANGECIGELITNVVNPTLYITIAEYSGNNGRTASAAAHTKTIGLCADPVTLDYWMGHNVMIPCGDQAANYDPAEDNVFRQILEGCRAKGVGTLNGAEMSAHVFDWDNES